MRTTARRQGRRSSWRINSPNAEILTHAIVGKLNHGETCVIHATLQPGCSALAVVNGRVTPVGTLDHASHSPSPGHSPLPFRPKAKTYALQPLERTLAGVIITLLIFLPWALGGLRVWGQWPMFGLSVLAFLIALIPRTGPVQARDHRPAPSWKHVFRE